MSFPDINIDYELNERERDEFVATARQIADTLFVVMAKRFEKRETLDAQNNFASITQTAIYREDAIVGFAINIRHFTPQQDNPAQKDNSDENEEQEVADELGDISVEGVTYEVSINQNDGLDSLEIGLGTLTIECGGDVSLCVDKVTRSVTHDADRDIDDEQELELTRDSRLLSSDLLTLLDIKVLLLP